MLIDCLHAVRPRQWFKNLFVLAPLAFGQRLLDLTAVMTSGLGFFCFCLLSSLIYVINDMADIEEDRQHPVKRNRPFASGRLALTAGYGLIAFLLAMTVAMAAFLPPAFSLVSLAYLLLQLVYTFFLKHMVILDLFAISAGFVLRVVGGGIVAAVPVSQWLLLCTSLLSLFLGLCKRRHELHLLGAEGTRHRAVLGEYSQLLLDQMIAVVTAATVVTYSLYATSPEVTAKLGTDRLLLTVPFVYYGIFRYLSLVYPAKDRAVQGGNPESVLLTDRPLLLNLFAWMVVVAVLLYFK